MRYTGKFFRHPGKTDDTVILIHGWGVRAFFMNRLADFLLNEGFSVLNYDYPTSKNHIPEHGKEFLERFREEQISGKLFFLTHSMGGLVLRYAMSEMTDEECKKIDSIVLLGPPNRGSLLAIPGKIPPIPLFNRSWGDMNPWSKILQIPEPETVPPFGIIAGTRDEKVSFRRTTLPDGIPFERVMVNSSHPGLRHPEKTGQQILSFFRTGKFLPE